MAIKVLVAVCWFVSENKGNSGSGTLEYYGDGKQRHAIPWNGTSWPSLQGDGRQEQTDASDSLHQGHHHFTLRSMMTTCSQRLGCNGGTPARRYLIFGDRRGTSAGEDGGMVLRWAVLRQRGGDPSAPIAPDPLVPSPSPPPILAHTRWNSGKGRRHMFTASAWPMFGLLRHVDMITSLCLVIVIVLIILMAHHVLQ